VIGPPAGGCGHPGSARCSRRRRRGRPGRAWRVGDVRDPVLAQRLAGMDSVIHLAVDWSLDAVPSVRSALNVRGTQTVVTAAAASGVKRVVIVTSASVYGALPDNAVPLAEDAPLLAVPEGIVADLLEMERVAEDARRVHPGLEVVVVRPAALVGPGVDTLVTRHFSAPRLLSSGHLARVAVLPRGGPHLRAGGRGRGRRAAVSLRARRLPRPAAHRGDLGHEARGGAAALAWRRQTPACGVTRSGGEPAAMHPLVVSAPLRAAAGAPHTSEANLGRAARCAARARRPTHRKRDAAVAAPRRAPPWPCSVPRRSCAQRAAPARPLTGPQGRVLPGPDVGPRGPRAGGGRAFGRRGRRRLTPAWRRSSAGCDPLAGLLTASSGCGAAAT
jgi:hypothetical protein